MASKAISNSFRYISKRGYAAPAVGYTTPCPVNLQVSVLPSKIFIAALDNGSPLTRATVAFKAGPRYEPPNDAGTAHMLRAAAGLTTGMVNTFILQRKLAQVGASVHASGDREFVYYTVETTSQNLNAALECLCNMVSLQEFRPWELSDISPRLMYDITSLPPQVRVVDLLHKAAFRRGLGNSLFISPKRIGTISAETLQHFAAACQTATRCAVTIVGDTQDKATLLAESIKLTPTKTEAYCEPSVYYGGELRKEMGGELTHVAIAQKGAPAGSQEAFALAIAAKALGCGPVTKWGADHSPIARAIGNIGPYAAAGFNVNYSDAGLFGIVLSVPKDEACKAVKAAATLLKSLCLDSNAIAAGKKKLMLQVLTDGDQSNLLSESMAAQGLYTGTALRPADIAQQINKIDDAFINSTLAKTAQSKLSAAAVGNISNTPYVDEL